MSSEEHQEPFYLKHPNFFRNYKFRFVGLFNSHVKKQFENLVECLGGTVCEESPYVFCDSAFAVQQNDPSDYYDFKYIKHSIQAHKPLDLEYFRFPARSLPSSEESVCCTHSKLLVSHDIPSTQYYKDNLECERCIKKINNENNDNDCMIPDSLEFDSMSDSEFLDQSKENSKTKASNSALPVNINCNQLESKSLEESPNLLEIARQSKNLPIADKYFDNFKQTPGCSNTASSNLPSSTNKKNYPTKPHRQIEECEVKKNEPNDNRVSLPASKNKNNLPLQIKVEPTEFIEPKIKIEPIEDEINEPSDKRKTVINTYNSKQHHMEWFGALNKNNKTDSRMDNFKPPHWTTDKDLAQVGRSKMKRFNSLNDSDSSEGNLDIDDVADNSVVYNDFLNLPKKKFNKVQAPRSRGRGSTISKEEQQFMIHYLVKNNLIHKAKSRARDSPWHHMHDNGYLKHRTLEALSNNMRKKILPNIEFYGLPRNILQKFLSARE